MIDAADPIRILVADDHPIVRQGLCAVLNAQDHMSVVGDVGDGLAMLDAYPLLLPDIVVLDMRMPKLEGLPALERLLADHPTARVLIVTTYDGEEDVFRAIRTGAKGYILKDAPYEQIVQAIERIHAGESFLSATAASRIAQRVAQQSVTPREAEVLRLAAEGLRNREIADRIERSEDTVKMHLKNAFEKLDAVTRSEAIATARKRGIIR